MMTLGESQWQPGAAERPLPGAHEVQVRDEAHRAPLLELDAEARARGDASRGRDAAPSPPAIGRHGKGRERLLQVQRRVRLLHPRPLVAIDDAAREADV